MALHDWNFLLITHTTDNVEEKQEHGSCHNAKVEGGKAFHRENVKNVVVVDANGKAYLYLSAGHPEKTVNVKSPY